MSGSDDEIVFVGETRDGGALESDAKRVRYDAMNGPALGRSTETPARTEFVPDPTAERHAPPLFRLFKTENTHNEACVSVSDLVRGPVRWAVVSNFKIDLDFMQDHAPELLAIPRVHWLHGQDDLPSWIRTHCPNKTRSGEWTTLKPATPQWGTHHSKFFLLVFPAGVRVVVHTANLCFGDLSAMSNAAWWQDFPAKTPGARAAHETSEFEEDLVRYLHRTGWRGRDEGSRFGHVGPEAFRAFDFAGAGAKLIGSVPGRPRCAARWARCASRGAFAARRS
jgi:tyrosyl-DNA phosphodiesterase-1